MSGPGKAGTAAIPATTITMPSYDALGNVTGYTETVQKPEIPATPDGTPEDKSQKINQNFPTMWCYCSELNVEDVSLIPVDIANWLRDTSVTLTDSVYIGLPKYEVPDAVWYTINGVSIDTASGIWVMPTEGITQYIQAIDVCDRVAYDTVTVYAYPLSNVQLSMNNLQLKVWPNPATNSINITCVSFLINQEKLQILDITGKELLHFIPDKNEMVIDISHLAKGVYFVKYGSENIQFVKE
jgi:hypothetical protein